MERFTFSNVMSPRRLIEKLEELNPGIKLLELTWTEIRVFNRAVDEILLPTDFMIVEEDGNVLKLSNAKPRQIGSYQPRLIFNQPKKEDGLP